jgi:hypothetical protein
VGRHHPDQRDGTGDVETHHPSRADRSHAPDPARVSGDDGPALP